MQGTDLTELMRDDPATFIALCLLLDVFGLRVVDVAPQGILSEALAEQLRELLLRAEATVQPCNLLEVLTIQT
jgi:hypothetical protein